MHLKVDFPQLRSLAVLSEEIRAVIYNRTVILCSILFFVGYMIYGNYQMNKLPGLSFEEALNYTLKGRNDAVITVGTIKDGEAFYKVYGENGKELAKNLHTYEIGSLTKWIGYT